MKRLFFTVLLGSIATASLAQHTFYDQDGNKTKKVVGIKHVLTFQEANSITMPDTASSKDGDPFEMLSLGGVLIDAIPKALEFAGELTTTLIDENLLKYTYEFEAQNSFLGGSGDIPAFNIERSFLNKSGVLENSLNMEFIPVFNSDESGFVYSLQSILVNESGAKLKSKYNHNNYSVELTIGYFDGKEKQEIKTSIFTAELIEVGKKVDLTAYRTELIHLMPNFRITDIHAKIIETNTAKIKAEKLKKLNDDYGDDLQDVLKSIYDFFTGEKDNDDEADS